MLEAILQIDWQDISRRAVKTFLQAFLSVFIISGASIIDLLFEGQWEALAALVISLAAGGLAAGLSAVQNLLQEVWRVHKLRQGAN